MSLFTLVHVDNNIGLNYQWYPCIVINMLLFAPDHINDITMPNSDNTFKYVNIVLCSYPLLMFITILPCCSVLISSFPFFINDIHTFLYIHNNIPMTDIPVCILSYTSISLSIITFNHNDICVSQYNSCISYNEIAISHPC